MQNDRTMMARTNWIAALLAYSLALVVAIPFLWMLKSALESPAAATA